MNHKSTYKLKSKKMKRKPIGAKFEARHKARELAVQFLYSLDALSGQDFDTALELFLSTDESERDEVETETETEKSERKIGVDTPEIKDFCRSLVRDAWESCAEIDALLLQVVTGWRPERMVSVDRAILRLIISEGFLKKTLPVKSAMSEAVRLADSFGTRDSARFVNGVLAKVMKFFENKAQEVN